LIEAIVLNIYKQQYYTVPTLLSQNSQSRTPKPRSYSLQTGP